MKWRRNAKICNLRQLPNMNWRLNAKMCILKQLPKMNWRRDAKIPYTIQARRQLTALIRCYAWRQRSVVVQKFGEGFRDWLLVWNYLPPIRVCFISCFVDFVDSHLYLLCMCTVLSYLFSFGQNSEQTPFCVYRKDLICM